MEDERIISTERGQHLGEQLGKTQVKKRESFIIDTLNRVMGVCMRVCVCVKICQETLKNNKTCVSHKYISSVTLVECKHNQKQK